MSSKDLTMDPSPVLGTITKAPLEPHPAGSVRYSGSHQIARAVGLVSWTLLCVCTIFFTQCLGSPLYLINKEWFYTYISLTKQSFGFLVITITQWWSPTKIRVSGDASVKGQIRLVDGKLECDFPERIVLIANHQLYSDWLYLWWVAYTSRMHGALYIILKESLKWVPVIGWGMQFYGFIFLARNWAKDQQRFAHRLSQLAAVSPTTNERSPMWMLIFPEGTNLSNNGRANSKRFADKTGIPDLQHLLLPRVTGLQYCLQQLGRGESVEWLYDCTMAYEGVPRDKYGQDFFTLPALYFEGRPPKSVNLHFRRFRVDSIPYNDPIEFEKWVRRRWEEKDEILEIYMQTGRLPGDGVRVLETEVQLTSVLEVGRIFGVLGSLALLTNVAWKIWNVVVVRILGVRQ